MHGVPSELREKLIELARQKCDEEIRRNFTPYQSPTTTPSLEEDNSPSEEETPLDTPKQIPTPQNIPTPPKQNEPELDYKKLYLALQQKNAELEQKIKELEKDKGNDKKREEIRNEILNSELSEEQKQKLLKLLEKQIQTSSENQPKPTNI